MTLLKKWTVGITLVNQICLIYWVCTFFKSFRIIDTFKYFRIMSPIEYIYWQKRILGPKTILLYNEHSCRKIWSFLLNFTFFLLKSKTINQLITIPVLLIVWEWWKIMADQRFDTFKLLIVLLIVVFYIFWDQVIVELW